MFIDIYAKDLTQHIQSNVTDHLFIVFQRSLEHESVLSKVYATSEQLNKQVQEQIAILSTFQATVATLTLAMEKSEANQTKELKNQIKQIDNKLTLLKGNLTSEYTTEITKLQKQIVTLQTQVTSLQTSTAKK